MKDLSNQLNQIKIILFDLHGVLASLDSNNFEVMESIKSTDNFCEKFTKLGYLTGIVSDSLNEIIKHQKIELENIKLLPSLIDKVGIVEDFLNEKKLSFENVFYIGDELLDLPLLQKVGYSAAPENARREVKRNVKIILSGDNNIELLTQILELFETKKSGEKRKVNERSLII